LLWRWCHQHCRSGCQALRIMLDCTLFHEHARGSRCQKRYIVEVLLWVCSRRCSHCRVHLGRSAWSTASHQAVCAHLPYVTLSGAARFKCFYKLTTSTVDGSISASGYILRTFFESKPRPGVLHCQVLVKKPLLPIDQLAAAH
jgi:hypothetical protein